MKIAWLFTGSDKDFWPLPFKVAQKLKIPYNGISNFTWNQTYHGLIIEQELDTLKKSYQKMMYFFSLAGSQENWSHQTNHYGLFSRTADWYKVLRIRRLVNPMNDQRIIFLGLEMKSNVSSLEQLPIWDSPNCVFLVSSNVHVERPPGYRIPSDYLESQNYIAASDLINSKGGWGIIGEEISASVPLLIVNRPSMKDDQNTINDLYK